MQFAVVGFLVAFVASALAESPCQSGAYDKCCVPGEYRVFLQGYTLAKTAGELPGVSLVESGRNLRQIRQLCHTTALLKVTFDKNDTCPEAGCLNSPACGQRMLKVELDLQEGMKPRNTDFAFNIGDSRTNNAFGGDSRTQTRDAEIHAVGSDIRLYEHDNCKSGKIDELKDVFQGARKLTLYISNEHVRITNDVGLDYWQCNECLFALNGQSEKEGKVNHDVYIGLNRIVAYAQYRHGFGICKAKLSWVCPWSN